MVNVKLHQYNLILAGYLMMTYNKSVATFSLYLIRICLLSRGSQVQVLPGSPLCVPRLYLYIPAYVIGCLVQMVFWIATIA